MAALVPQKHCLSVVSQNSQIYMLPQSRCYRCILSADDVRTECVQTWCEDLAISEVRRQLQMHIMVNQQRCTTRMTNVDSVPGLARWFIGE